MTAEIAIINRNGVALAADSAVTIGQERVWKTANKLFSLGPINDIAVMIYNAGDHAGIPWEAIVKHFRTKTGKRRFNTVTECESAFFEFLRDPGLTINENADLSITSVLITFAETIFLEVGKHKRLKDLEAALAPKLPDILSSVKKQTSINTLMPLQVFRRKFRSQIGAICKDVMGFRLSKTTLDAISEIKFEMLCREFPSSYMSGVVFAGYGRDQLLPYVSHYFVDGRLSFSQRTRKFNICRHWLHHKCDMSDPNKAPAYVIPFAQFDMFYLFMEGILPKYILYISNIVDGILKHKTDELIKNYVPSGERLVEQKLQDAENDKIIHSFMSVFAQLRCEDQVDQILDVIEALPKEEMAAMAEALVELTALRRKVGPSLESVAGPTDVAVISKAEGLIWLKRKHYFDPKLNGDFTVRKRELLEERS